MNTVLSLVGNTPLLELGHGITAKAEFYNPTGSIKDRMVKFILEKSIEGGGLRRGMAIVESTSGNTGISLAYFAARFGMKAIVLMPRSASLERRRMVRALGAKLVLTETKEEARKNAIEIGKRRGFFHLNQFASELNVQAHYEGLGREIVEQAGRKIGSFVAAIGTGGTLAGAGKRIREEFPGARIVGIMARDKKDEIEGIYPEYFGELLEKGLVDKMARVSNRKALEGARFLIREKGLLAGISSGANYYAARRFGKGHTVTVLPDSWDRYYSTRLFDNN